MQILIIDNFDSFTNNIAQYVHEACGVMPVIVPNTAAEETLNLHAFDAVILSPGPGHPARAADFGVCRYVLATASLPILGVCLGHQGISHFYGGTVEHAPRPVHGYRSKIEHCGQNLFIGIPQGIEVVRYHSLICTSVPDCLEVTARTQDGLIMALAHRERPVYGVQFHPESIDSECGHQIILNFIQLVREQSNRVSSICPLRKALHDVGGPTEVRCQMELLSTNYDPAGTFSALFADFPTAFWLDSELSDSPNARYSIMGGSNAQSTLKFSYAVDTNMLSIAGPKGCTSVPGDFFQLMDTILKILNFDEPEDAPVPFRAGFIGYLGYELKALTGSPNTHASDLPDALLYLPQNIIVFDHQTSETWLCHFWGSSLTLPDHSIGPLKAQIPLFIPGAVAEEKLSLADSSETYIEKVKTCLQQINDGESYEICLTNRAQLQLEDDPLSTYLRMRLISPVPYGAYLKDEHFSVLSASPETFLKIEANGRIKSKPIKGTRPRGNTPEHDNWLKQDLQNSAKDRAENLMIVDLVRHDLNGICVPGTIKVPVAFDIETYSSVHQLVSTIQGKLRHGIGPFAAIKACFPGGSMTGAPKLRTMEIIDRLESSARGVYSGALGWIGLDGYTHLSIVIRTAVVRGQIAQFGIGGAIVAASDPQEEMQETLVKASVPFYSIKGQVDTTS